MTTATVEAAPIAAPPRVVAALVGRQNAGKTSLLMHVTGHTQRPVNFPGSSVERGESEVDVDGILLRLVDLPGVASLTPASPDERITLDYLAETGPDAPQVLCVVLDASKLPVELTLLSRVMTIAHPIVVALNKTDVAASEGRPVDVATLRDALQVPVVPTNARTGDGAAELRQALVRAALVPHQPRGAFDPRALADRVQQPDPDAPTGPSWTDRIDAVVLHPLLGMPILLLVMYGMFQALFTLAAPFMDFIDAGQGALQEALAGAIDPGALQSLLSDGIVAGVGSVLIFLPQIALLMLIVALLEGSGYMARAAFVLDRPLSRVGLSGRSFVPLVSSFACAVPGILASRIVESERDRIATIVVSPLMSCSARLPVYVLLIGAFFPTASGGLVLLALYALGIVLAAVVAGVLRKTALRGAGSSLMMELPVYQRPSWRVVGAQVWAGCRDFLVLAGTVIFAASVVIWLLSYYPRPESIHRDFSLQRAAATQALDGDALEAEIARLDAAEGGAYLEQSYLAGVGRFIQPVFAPAGWDWRTSVGVVAAFPARELIVPTLGILYSVGEVDTGDLEVGALEALQGSTPAASALGSEGLRARMTSARRDDGTASVTPLVAAGIMVFFALCSQCIGTLAAIRRETRSWRWPLFTFTYMTVLAWLAAVLVYQIGTAAGWG